MNTNLDNHPHPKYTTKKVKKSSRKRKESLTGYALVAPALLLIFAIAIWPVFQSFYYSLFDLKLNDPTKSTVNINYSLDLANYLDNYPFLITEINKAADQSTANTQLKEVKTDLQTLDEKIKNNPKVGKSYKEINDRLMNFEKIPADLALIKIDGRVAKEYQKTIGKLPMRLKEINDQAALENGDKMIGLAKGLRSSIIKPNFVGLQHYKEGLTSSRMWKALGQTTMFTLISVFFELILGLAIALLINKAFIGRGLVRASILIPWAVPTAVSALMWKFLYDGQNGIMAKLFEQFGIVESMATLLSTGAGAMFSVIFADVWKTTPYMALLILAGLQTIPENLYEAAAIDGAGKWKQFTRITLPLLNTSILVALLFRTLDAFRVFDLILVLTGGGPANSTEVISLLAYKVMFSQTNFGYGSMLAIIVFICVAIISTFYIKLLGKDLIKDGSAK